jgi:hypothetical protein
LDNDVSLILYFDCHGKYIIYKKNNTIIYSNIKNFKQLTDSYVINYVGQHVIQSLCNFVLDSHNDLYELIVVYGGCIVKKISINIVNFFCDAIYVYTIDTESKIHCIGKYDYNKKIY